MLNFYAKTASAHMSKYKYFKPSSAMFFKNRVWIAMDWNQRYGSWMGMVWQEKDIKLLGINVSVYLSSLRNGSNTFDVPITFFYFGPNSLHAMQVHKSYNPFLCYQQRGQLSSTRPCPRAFHTGAFQTLFALLFCPSMTVSISLWIYSNSALNVLKCNDPVAMCVCSGSPTTVS